MKTTSINRNYFYLLLLFALYVAYRLFSPYLGVVVFAFVTVVVFRPLYLFFVSHLWQREDLAVLFTILTILVLVLVPFGLVFEMTVTQVVQFSQEVAAVATGETPLLQQAVAELNAFLTHAPVLQQIGMTITEDQILETAQQWLTAIGSFLAEFAVNVGTSSVDWITRAIIYLSLLGAMFPGWPAIAGLFRDLSPLEDKLDQQYIDRIVLMTQAMVRGTFVLVALQGIAMALLLWVVGVPYVFFWGLLASVVAILPGGCGLIALPISLYLFLTGNVWQGVVVLLGYVVVIANIDPLVRPRLVPKEAQFNPALILLSLAGGVKLFGFLGVIYGPIVLVFLITTVEIYMEYYNPSKRSSASDG